MTLQAILTLAAAVFALAVKPGAGMMCVISRSVAHGMSGCWAFLIGFNVALLTYLSLVLFGLSFVDVDLLFISILVKSIAAVYLIWAGVKGLQEPVSGLSVEDIEMQNFFDTVVSALVLTLSNPLIILFYAGILPTILGATPVNAENAFVIALIVLGIETAVVLVYCLPIVYFRKKVSPVLMGYIKAASSIVLIGLGLYIGYTAIAAQDLLAVF